MRVRVSTQALRLISRLPNLEDLHLLQATVDEQSFEVLSGLHKLLLLMAVETDVSEDILNRLRRLLPQCDVVS